MDSNPKKAVADNVIEERNQTLVEIRTTSKKAQLPLVVTLNLHPASNPNPKNTVKVICGNETFEVSVKDLEKIPYLEALRSFKLLSLQVGGDAEGTEDEEPPITLDTSHINGELMKLVLKFIKNGRMKSLFTSLPAGFNANQLFKLMDFLLIKKPKSTLADLDKRLKDVVTARDKYGICGMAQRSLARDTEVELCWTACDIVSSDHREEQKLDNLILYIMSHTKTYYYNIRRITLEWYLSHYPPTAKQTGILRKWHEDHPYEQRRFEPENSSSGGSDVSSGPDFYDSDGYYDYYDSDF